MQTFLPQPRSTAQLAIIGAVICGLSHLPTTAALVKLTPLLVVRAILLNAELKQLSRDEQAHLESEFDNYEQRFALDERGVSRGSPEFADRLIGRREAGAKALAFLIGGADGLSPEARDLSDEVVSFGAMTLPHQLVRVLLLEQIYRALTIRLGHPYHRFRATIAGRGTP